MIEKIIGPFLVKSSRLIYKSPWLELREDNVIRPGGAEGVFGVITMREGSSILPFDNDGYVYLVKEFKYGIAADSLEVISGGLDEGESPIEAAKRELAEEAKLVADEWTDLGCVHPFTTVVQSPNHIFLARRLRPGNGQLDDGEKLSLRRVPFAEALKMVMQGEIIHAASCVVILKTAQLLKIV